ncbi:alpha/beta hydrolase [Aquipuribacter sp. SD81]|uniref:alpha/beta hydrolase n=1 Tax=Aquipuribacter sp. SD81 TaxID=3127703 RepID=UPI00301A0423
MRRGRAHHPHPRSQPQSLPVDPLVRLLDAAGRRVGGVGIAGRDPAAARAAVPGPVVGRVLDAVYDRPDPTVRRHDVRTAEGVRLAVHTPPVAAGTRLPVVVHIHGGGWVLGGVDDTPWWVAALARAVPAVVVSVDYRLAPEHPFPAGADDCLAAVRWCARHPEHVGSGTLVRTDRVGLAGDSAGANLCAVTSARLRDEPRAGDPVVAAQVLVYPALDATLASPSVARNAHAPFLSLADMRAFVAHYLDGTGTAPQDPLVSPLHVADLAGLPPTTVLTAEHDPLHDEGVAYAQRLRAAGVPVRHTDYPGAVHGFLSTAGLGRTRARHALDEVAAALRQELDGPADATRTDPA